MLIIIQQKKPLLGHSIVASFKKKKITVTVSCLPSVVSQSLLMISGHGISQLLYQLW